MVGTVIPHDICIDVSRWQGVIDWPAVAASGIRIAMIKASEGSAWVDPRWDENRAAAENAGIVVIPYHFLRPENPTQQAAHFRRVGGIVAGTPFALDWEGRASETATTAECEAIGAELAAVAGRLPLGYWGIPGSTPATPTAAMLEWPRWVARYPKAGCENWQKMAAGAARDPVRYWLTGRSDGRLPEFAQYTQWGKVPGVIGDVDRNVAFFASADDAVTWCRCAPAAPVAAPLIDPIPASAETLQTRLVELGYRLRVDGKAGALTCGAALDALKRITCA